MYSPTGSIDHDGIMQTEPEISGRQSVGFAWKGFDALMTLGFTCNLQAASHIVSMSIGWQTHPENGFATKHFSAKSRVRSAGMAATN